MATIKEKSNEAVKRMIFLLPPAITCKLTKIFIFIVLTVVLILAARPADAKIHSTQQMKADKVVVLVIDDLGIEDLKNTTLKNLNKIAASSIIGMMNTRTKSFTAQGRQDAYLTIGMGTRVHVPRSGIENETFVDSLKKIYPNNVPGKIGEVANKTGKRIALLGNTDTDNKINYTLLMAMDSFGYVDTMEVGSQFLTGNPKDIWSMRTDSKRLLFSCKKAVQTNDIIFIDFGDTTRVAEARDRLGINGDVLKKMRSQALKRADKFLGEFVKIIDNKNVLLLVVSPTSPVDNNFTGIKNLAPVLLYKNGNIKGLLISNTTRREGLISNIDIAPSIFAFLGVDTTKMQFTGEKMTIVTDIDPLKTIGTNFNKYSGLKKFRYILHGVYVILLLLVFYYIYFPVLQKKQQVSQRFSRAISVMIFALPIISSVSALWLQNLTAAVAGFFILLLFTGYFLSVTIEISLIGMATISLATSALLIFDLITGLGCLVNTPLGFNDVFTGGRYYGINNDSMGILLGSTVFGVISILKRFASKVSVQITVTAGVFFLAFLSQTPGLGANVGGTIAAITTGTLACFMLASGQPPSMKSLLLVIILALAAEFSISFMETLSASQTHAGKTVARLLSDNFTSYLIEIISSKISVFLAMLMLPPWNVLFFGQLYLYRRVTMSNFDEIKNIEINDSLTLKSFQIILYGSFAALIFNDTGIIAAAMMLIYLTVPFGMLLVREGYRIDEYGEAITQRI